MLAEVKVYQLKLGVKIEMMVNLYSESNLARISDLLQPHI